MNIFKTYEDSLEEEVARLTRLVKELEDELKLADEEIADLKAQVYQYKGYYDAYYK